MLTSHRKQKALWAEVVDEELGACVKKKMRPDADLTSDLTILLTKTLQGYQCISSHKLQELQELARHQDREVRWLSLECIGSHLKMSDVDKIRMKTQFELSPEEDLKFGLKFQLHFQKHISELSELVCEVPESAKILFQDSTPSPKNGIHIRKVKIESELNPDSDSEYILLPSHSKIMKEIASDLISVKLTPICVYGPTGVGKSTLIKLTASCFKRHKYPDIIYVQMSDQIDSRLLLGSYHSTDLPGQFVWKPGCLTKAVLKGYWIVLEDLDSASADVLTLFDGLIDAGALSVPGYGEIRKFHEDFRILSTCRTFGGSGDGRLLDKIGRQWRKYQLEALSPLDMKILLASLYPNLKYLAEKLSTIFNVMEEAKQILGSKNRLLSLRDFLKLCRRIPKNLDFTKPASAVKIFQECFDLFVASLYDPSSRKQVAEKLGAHLNILISNVEYFCGAYKPVVSIDINSRLFTSGRYTLQMMTHQQLQYQQSDKPSIFSLTKRACCLLEMICSSVHQQEPVLLLGETGVGKTSCVQFLAETLCQKFVVVNLNRQSDSSDLLGGYKPVELKYIFAPIREEFETLFRLTFRRDTNQKFLDHLMTSYANRNWKILVQLMAHVQRSAVLRQEKLKDRKDVLHRWVGLGHQISRIEAQLGQGEESPFAFSFIEGTLIDAIRKGHWILLDEINLATPEMLQCLSGVLESHAQIHLWEKGDEAPIKRHKNFHLFAAMNPSTDVGKKDLPLGLRNRFTEYFVDELTDADELQILVSDYLRDMSLSMEHVRNIVKFYLNVKYQANGELVDGTGKKPHFSLRTLCRALKIASQNIYGSVNRSLYESFCISFLTQLDYSSHPVVQRLIARHIFGNQDMKSILNQALPQPSANHVCVEGYWLPKGDAAVVQPEKYILTASIRRNLKDIARIVSAGKLPVLIQGETSVGKTSLIQYLASVSGNRCFRINNHQHTDLQEYVGSYQSDQSGKLVFTEGVLVQAMRRGEWVILDELNLAPSEVLEALNRLLDDNRQLFITETGVTVTAHPRFMLFATQNPPGLYGGRKLLSRAFRNRFVELHFDEIPSSELETILHLRCDIPPSYCKKIIGVMKELQMRRKSSAALQGKHGFATLRDLFRWAERYRLSNAQKSKFYDWDQHLAEDGYLVLAGKVRVESEADLIRQVLKHHFKRTVEPENLFSLHEKTSASTREILESVLEGSRKTQFGHVVWTFQMRRLVVLIGNAMKFNEPVLLVGETGCGKTTVVQILTELLKKKLFSVNCHMHSEGSDFLGGLRPVRIRYDDDERLFEWVNGPLVEAMEQGGIFLADEISLADDSVLERVNSVLEPERTLLISEKGDETLQVITAHENFQFVGTMNPGGDYGKKELSPALRNRLTEIWCPNTAQDSDLIAIIEHNLDPKLQNLNIGVIMTKFCNWLRSNELCSRIVVSIRDYLAWVNFANTCVHNSALQKSEALLHGAFLTFLDGLGSGHTSVDNSSIWTKCKEDAVTFLQDLLLPLKITSEVSITSVFEVRDTKESFSIGVFSVPKTPLYSLMDDCPPSKSCFSIEAPTTCQNGLRLLRAMQLPKPILLEGSPGVGKTAIVTALAKFTNNTIVRINLSEQTDISDLFGADLPVEGETGGRFAWRDGPLLQALKNESWILLDELNLASQSVLEGLNACLDHRGEIFVPELNRSFKILSNSSRIFGCQNPVRQGGARKGLPKSFLNRFTQVFIDPLNLEDLNFVLKSAFPRLPSHVVELMGRFSEELNREVCLENKFASRGAPWDFNLRDLLRWAELVTKEEELSEGVFAPDLFVDLIYGLRMRTEEDRAKVLQLYKQVRGSESGSVVSCGSGDVLVKDDEIQCGTALLKRLGDGLVQREKFRWDKLLLRKDQMAAMEGTMKCLQMGWMPILVGAAGSGKTSLVKLIAQMCGRDLQIMTPSPEMDTIELLGGFEQADIYRRLDELSGHLRDLMLDIARYLMAHHENPYNSIRPTIDQQLARAFWAEWTNIQQLQHLAPQESLGQSEELERLEHRVELLGFGYSACKSLLDDPRFIICEEDKFFGTVPCCSSGGSVRPHSESDRAGEEEEDSDSSSAATLPLRRNISSTYSLSEEPVFANDEEKGPEEDEEQRLKPHRIHEASQRVQRELQDIHSHLTAGIQTGGFQWIHSLLIKAVLTGEWLLIDGANRCTCAVLDRLNCLMEPGGSVLLSERGSVDGEIAQIRPHPNFRLILAIRPSFGEISRAMRNRGVEIFMPGTISSPGPSGLCLDDFVNSQWLRVWQSMRVLERALESSLFTQQQGFSTDSAQSPVAVLIVSLLSRTFPEDAPHLALAISNKFPQLSSLLKSIEQVPLKLDEQFEPSFVAKFRGKQLSVSASQSLILSTKSILDLHRAALYNFKLDFPRNSLGAVSEALASGRMGAVKEFEPFRQILLDFWNVWTNLNLALESMFSAAEWYFGDRLNLTEVAQVWLKGLKVLEWIQRLACIAREELSAKRNNEILIAHLRLLLGWIEEDVLKTLKMILRDDPTGARALGGIKGEALVRGQSEAVKGEEILRLKSFPAKSLKLAPERENQFKIVTGILGSVFKIWSCSNAGIPVEKWPEFLTSDIGKCFYFEISRLCALINSPELEFLFDNQSMETFSNLLKHFKRDENSFGMEDVEQAPTNVQALKFNLGALKEFLRLTQRGSFSSMFANPWLDLLPKEDSLARFLRVEEQARFCTVFLNRPAFLENSCFLPAFVSRILLDTRGEDFRKFNLSERKVVEGFVGDLKKILERECFEISRIPASENMQKQLQEFERDLETLLDDLDRLKVSEEIGDVLALLEEVKWEREPDLKMLLLGQTLVTGAGVLMEILVEAPLVDPAVKSRILAGYLSDDIDFFETWRSVHEFHVEQRTNQLPPADLAHPYTGAALNYVSDSRSLYSVTTQNIADRPDVPEYNGILRDLRLFLNSFASKEKLEKISSRMRALFENSAQSRDEYLHVKTIAESTLAGFRNFQVKLSGHVWYWDIVGPIVFVSSWVSKGLTLMLQALAQKFERPAENLVSSLQTLVSFPVEIGSTIDVNILVKNLTRTKGLSKLLLRASLLNLANQVQVMGRLTENVVSELHKISLAFTHAWNAQEDEKKRKQEEEDALYIYKGKERKIDLTEEEQEAKELKEMFPSFAKDFDDLIEQKELTDSAKIDADEVDENEKFQFGAEDLALFFQIHSKVFQLVKTAWIEGRGKSGEPDFVGPFMGRFKIGALGYDQFGEILSWDDENDFALGASFTLKHLVTREFEEKIYDIYHHANPKEVEKLPPILEGLRKRVEELLREWPDHPSLKKVMVVIERLETFLVEAPVMKYLTGLELLLETCQDWESNAHAGVSIATHLGEITQVIVDWRKLELSYWKNLLEITAQKEQDLSLKWWFFISSSVMEAISDPETSTDSLLQALRQFMETSPLGQYETRLSLLHQIHCYFLSLEKFSLLPNSVPKSIHSILWNTLKFYDEFRPIISTRLSTLRTPIEKKLRDFVKILRWNDMNFSSLKDSVLKSQKMLGKSVREFKRALAIPARSLLVSDDKLPPKSKAFVFKEDHVEWFVMGTNEYEKDACEALGGFLLDLGGAKGVGKIWGKMRQMTESAVKTRLEKLAPVLELVTDICDEARHAGNDLQEIEIQEKGDKRKKFLHHVHSRRRLALAELFKNLTKLDLSYKKGLLRIQKYEPIQDFQILPHDLGVGWRHLNNTKSKAAPSDSFLIKLYSSGAESLFQKSSIRLIAMLKAFQSPNKQLSVAIIDRCKGFGSELMSKVMEEKRAIATFSTFLWNLRNLLQTNLQFQFDPDRLTQKLLQKCVELEFEFGQWKLFLASETSAVEFLPLVNNVVVKSSQVRGLLEPFSEVNAKLEDLKEGVRILEEILREEANVTVLQKKTLVSEKIERSFENLREFLKYIKKQLEEQGLPVDLDRKVEGLLANEFTKLLKQIMLGFQRLDDFRAKFEFSKEAEEMSCLGLGKVAEDFEDIVGEFSNCPEFLEVLKNFSPVLKQYLMLGQFYLTELVAVHREHCQLLTVLCCLFTTLGQKGFNLPPDYEDEAQEEGSELDAKGGLGLGDGETTSDAKDVSDRIDNEDQLEEALKPGESSTPGDTDMPENEKGIEMPDDFEGNLQDESKPDGEKKPEDDDSDAPEDETDHDKQMGDVDDPGADKLDEQLWGGSSDEEEENLDETKDTGGERQDQVEPELKAKDPQLDEVEAPEDKNKEYPEEQKQNQPKDPEEEDEANDDQIDPYHGNNQPEVEPEALDLPEDLNLDDGEMNDKEQDEENPFDLDAESKDQEIPEESEENPAEKEAPEIENEQTEMDKEEGPDEEATPSGVNIEPMETEEPIIEEKENKGQDAEKPEETVPEELPEEQPEEGVNEESIEKKDETKNEKDHVDASEEIKDQADENVQGNQSQAREMQVSVEEHLPDQKDETGTGQAESSTGQGHEGNMAQKEEQHRAKEESDEKDASRKPGETDRKRTLASEQAQSKRLKTIENPDESEETPVPDEAPPVDTSNAPNADLYQHVTQSEKADATTMDNASMEDAQKQPEQPESTKEGEEPPPMEDEPEPDVQVVEKETAETVQGPPQDKPSKNQKMEDTDDAPPTEEPMQVEVEGETIASYSVQRDSKSTVHTVNELYSSLRVKGDIFEDEQVEEVAFEDSSTSQGISACALGKWHELENVTLPLAQELCEQLRLILEPTLAARLRGDYKTGKRLNMRKVIPYVASGFRKDKIWLRRTQPSKREYQILLALDDSASMSDNQSKQMAFSAVAVVAKSLSLLESGQLSVVSFGEKIDLMHPFDEPFTDQSGAHLLEKFTFAQRQTRIAQLMTYVTSTLSDQKNSSGSSSLQPEFAQLVLIISDGRNVSSEGKDTVARAIKKAREENIFMVFVIVDNPQNKDSILDVRYAEFDEKNNLKQFNYYMDHFPFPFYLILRDLSSLPSVLSDALRQWFELVTSGDR